MVCGFADSGKRCIFAAASLQGRVKFPTGGKVRELQVRKLTGGRAVATTAPTVMLAG